VLRSSPSGLRHSNSSPKESNRCPHRKLQPISSPRKVSALYQRPVVDAQSGKTFTTPNPATGEVLAEVAEAGAADVDLAVQAARRAFESGKWAKMSARDRGRVLYKVSQLNPERTQEIAELETADNGKPLRDSL